MGSIAHTTEDVFLTFVKRIIVVAMALSVLSALGLGCYSIFQLVQSPKQVELAETTELKPEDVKLGSFISKLPQETGIKESGVNAQSVATQADAAKVTRPYFAEAKLIYQCSLEFASAVGQPIKDILPSDEDAQIEMIRALITGKDGVSEWAPKLPQFICASLKTKEIIDFRKRNPKSGMLIPLIDFHHFSWKSNNLAYLNSIQEREKIKQDRIDRESERIAIAHQSGFASLYAGGICLALFLGLAMYLVFVRIESNLADINRALQKS